MIFHDERHRRKYWFRTISVLIFLLFISLTYLLWLSIFTTPLSVTAHEADAPSNMQIALTFDDGPHPVYTPAILKILREKEVPAGFFFIGQAMLKHPDVVRQTHAAGHEIGNHSFTHSTKVHEGQRRTRFELQTTNHILENIIGQQARFYRSPYLVDFGAASSEFITEADVPVSHPLKQILDLGYVGVSAYIDPQDWDVTNSDVLTQRVLNRTQHGSVLLLHDGGIQKEATLEALPTIIDELRAQGFEFVSLSELSGIPAYHSPAHTLANDVSTYLGIPILGTTYSTFHDFLFAATALTILLGIARLLFLLGCRLLKRPPKPRRPDIPVSVLIPAYNEEKNLAATITSVARSTHEQIEILVIDDGSKDNTRAIAEATAQTITQPLTYLYKPNGGKASALNVGLAHASHNVVVAIDGDTIIHPDAISHLAIHFHDPQVGGVAGRVCAITNHRLLGWFQDIEYTVSQNIEKEAFYAAWGSIAVIPGAIGAWRKKAVQAVGGYSDDTLTEDQDLTLALHGAGYAIRYERHAIAYTEVPLQLKSFAKQRFRWSFGTVQCLWKYYHFCFDHRRPQLGFVIIPYGLFFSILSPLMMPIIDLMLIYEIFLGGSTQLLWLALLFLAIDLIYHAIGLLPEPSKLKLLPVVPLQRIFYRMVLSYVILKSLLFAIEGTRSYWGTQLRTGSAQALLTTHQELYKRLAAARGN